MLLDYFRGMSEPLLELIFTYGPVFELYNCSLSKAPVLINMAYIKHVLSGNWNNCCSSLTVITSEYSQVVQT